MPKRLIGCLVVLGLLALFPAILDEYTVRVLNGAIIAAIAVMGLNFAFGYSGLMSMSQASFMGVSAYLLAILTTRFGMNVWLAVLVAVLVTALFVIAAGRVLLKLRGHYLALGTLGLNVSLTIIMLNWVDVTGGSNGIGSIPPLTVGTIPIAGEHAFYWFGIVVLMALAGLAVRIKESHTGRAMIAVCDDEISTAMTGMSVPRVKLTAFALSGLYAAIAGCLFATHMQFVSPDDFSFDKSIVFLSMLVVGGSGSIVGSILGATALTLLPELLRFVGTAYLLVFGVLVLLVLTFFPGGLAGLLLRPRWPRRASLRAPVSRREDA